MSSIKSEVIETLKGHKLTRVLNRQPTHEDVNTWMDEIAQMASLITVRTIPGGIEHGLLATVIPEEEYQLEIEDEDYEYEEPTDPGSYPELDGDEEPHEVSRLEAEHKDKQNDFIKYTAFKQHIANEFTQCVDSTWIEDLSNGRSKYTNVSPKQFIAHLKSEAARLSTQEKSEMKKKIFITWDQVEDLKAFIKRMELLEEKALEWDVVVSAQDMVNHAVLEMQKSNFFEPQFLEDWEERPDAQKSWNEMKNYYLPEYRTRKKYRKNNKAFESANNVQEQRGGKDDVTEFFDEFRRDALVGKEQIQQMASTFNGAAGALSKTMEQLKVLTETVEKQEKTIATLTATNKQLTETNASLTKLLGNGTGGKPADEKPTGNSKRGDVPGYQQDAKAKETNPKKWFCHMCGLPHAKPFKQYCWELEKNKSTRPAGWKSRM